MARIRTVKPDFFSSRTTARLSYGARLTFIGLWTNCDDEGRCLAETRLLKAAIWPLDDEVTPDCLLSWTAELAACRLIVCYQAGADNLIQVRNWKEHQRINRPKASKYPAPTQADMDRENSVTAWSLTNQCRGGDPSVQEGNREQGREQGTGKAVAVHGVTAGTNGTNAEPPPRKTASGKPDRAPSWVGEAHELYAAAIGLVPHGRLGKALKPAVDAYTWPAVKRWFTAYCQTRPYQKRDGSFHGDHPRDKPDDAVKDTRFCSPEDFAANLATWRERCAPLVPR